MNSKKIEHILWIIGGRTKLPFSKIWAYFLYGGLPRETLVSFRSAEINRPSIKASKIEEILDGAYLSSFEVVGEGFSFSYGQNGGSDFDRIIVESASFILSPEFSDELILETVADDASFTQAHLVDKDYQHLQNIFDPLQFKALGISMEGLPMKSNGLPFPLEQQIVDTSENPGRFKLRKGYVETAAAYMWFGKNFWPIVGTEPDSVITNLPDNVSFRLEKCWRLKATTGVFRDLATRETQNRIRLAVFG